MLLHLEFIIVATWCCSCNKKSPNYDRNVCSNWHKNVKWTESVYLQHTRVYWYYSLFTNNQSLKGDCNSGFDSLRSHFRDRSICNEYAVRFSDFSIPFKSSIWLLGYRDYNRCVRQDRLISPAEFLPMADGAVRTFEIILFTLGLDRNSKAKKT